MFTCQATVHKNETTRSNVIVPFNLHVWKSFMCGRHIGKHLLCRLVTKGLHGVGKHVQMYRFHEFGNRCSCLSWSWCCELWIMLHPVKYIHSRCALTFTACVDVTCAKLQAYKFHTGFVSTMLKNIW